MVQPSEIAKIVCILLNAYFIAGNTFRNRLAKDRMLTMGICFAPTLIIAMLVASQNLSTAIIITMFALAMYFIAYPKPKFFLAIFAGMVPLAMLAISMLSYRSSRIKVWKHPENYKSGYQTMQGLYAIGSGGTFGKGLGNSLQKKFVPEAQNDMIFTLICEELGLVGAILIIVVYIFLLWRMFDIACRAKDKMGSFLVIGVMAHIAIQVLLNIAVATNTMPNTGVTLQFISYGGSALWMLMFEMGVVLNVAKSAKFRD
jgi:cell division protein FtsW